MIKLEKTDILGWEHAIRGMRNPMNSWEKTDSGDICTCREMLEKGDNHIPYCLSGFYPRKIEVSIGPNDHALMMKLAKAGSTHAKYRRMITVYVDITAPLYWWKEFDTYKVGTVANSCSTMHKIHEKEFELSDFSWEKLIETVIVKDNLPLCGKFVTNPLNVLEGVIESLNVCRQAYLETKDKVYWDQMIQLLPSSYEQKRTIMFNYEVLANIYETRRNHKLEEWHKLCEWIESLPYSEIITLKEGPADDHSED